MDKEFEGMFTLMRHQSKMHVQGAIESIKNICRTNRIKNCKKYQKYKKKALP